MSFRLTVRHGSRVDKASFQSLDEAIEAMASRSREIRRDGPLDKINALRDYGPGDRVHARLALSAGGRLRGRDAGIDVMGDGSLVPFTGFIRRRRLEPQGNQTAFEAVRQALL